MTERVDGSHLGHHRSGGRLRLYERHRSKLGLQVLAEWIVRRLNWETRLLRDHEPCLLWLNTEWLLEWGCTKRASLGEGIECCLLLEENGGWTPGLRVEYRCLFLVNCSEEVLHRLGTIGRFGRRTRGTRLGITGSGFFRGFGGRSAHLYVQV